MFLDIPVKGDLSSLSWVKMPPVDPIEHHKTIHITHAGLNFRDVMIASGRIPVDTVTEEASNISCFVLCSLFTVLFFVSHFSQSRLNMYLLLIFQGCVDQIVNLRMS